MKRIGVLYHPRRSDSSRLARDVSDILTRRGIDIWRGSTHDEDELRRVASGLDVLITLGGDGTIVRAVRVVAQYGLPILGVNLGRLGFLAEVEPSRIQEALPALWDGQYAIEERMMLRVELRAHGDMCTTTNSRTSDSWLSPFTLAINDIVMARGVSARTVRISVEVDGRHVMTPTADGIIVSTPTGSTAYCLAAGGPIVAPDLDCLTITPIAAHLGIIPSFVTPAHRHVCLRLDKGEGARLTVDGQLDVALEPGDEACCTISETTAKFIRFGGDGTFYETILRKLGWPDRHLTR